MEMKVMQACLVEIWNSKLKKSEWVNGKIIGSTQLMHIDRQGYDVLTDDGKEFRGCHPDCVKVL